MIIPKDVLIAEEKIRDYLLVEKPKGDKSRYLGLAGYTQKDYWELLRDIRQQLLPAEGIFQRTDKFGDYYIIKGHLKGPNGRRLGVRTIWLHDKSDQIRFATLFPD
jgi:hypothetical protein